MLPPVRLQCNTRVTQLHISFDHFIVPFHLRLLFTSCHFLVAVVTNLHVNIFPSFHQPSWVPLSYSQCLWKLVHKHLLLARSWHQGRALGTQYFLLPGSPDLDQMWSHQGSGQGNDHLPLPVRSTLDNAQRVHCPCSTQCPSGPPGLFPWSCSPVSQSAACTGAWSYSSPGVWLFIYPFWNSWCLHQPICPVPFVRSFWIPALSSSMPTSALQIWLFLLSRFKNLKEFDFWEISLVTSWQLDFVLLIITL